MKGCEALGMQGIICKKADDVCLYYYDITSPDRDKAPTVKEIEENAVGCVRFDECLAYARSLEEDQASAREKQLPSEGADPNNPEKKWYKLNVPSSNAPRKGETHNLYVFAEDPIDALGLAQEMSGWKKGIGTHKFPDVHPLGSEETDELLERIEETENVTLKQALKDGFHGRR